ncbi:hypothetical protein TraAM80_09417 [Trypanosoma rangeli]|uniref:Uncharacterized protein n=1 Tax=Trypanosoma rangeli TaxID=5698 RepID=A0A3R7JUY0_TRYRA|nr:uncharacterized protein TraAM80_09417 [Trypanosoma rangeli]RNE97236.1 hypothetical protein TraAM80_09417 [Trypanosoma rangeli]|eukprot:RNE97236.1 hypothetical protein TraAM80_09417 [Trypanosoma rangeli]
MHPTSNVEEGASSEEPPAKVARHEDDIKTHAEQAARELHERVTLFIRSTQIHSRGELMNGVLRDHREALGIQSWYVAGDDGSGTEPTMILRPDAPVECIFVKTSRKPYFLLECTEGGEAAKAFVGKLTGLHSTAYKGHPLFVEVAKEGITVSGERRKLEMRDAAKRASSARSKSPAGTAAVRPPTATTFVPRVLR